MMVNRRLFILPLIFVFSIVFAAAAFCQDTAGAAGVAGSAGPDVTIKKIDVTGNFEVPDEEIMSVVVSKEGEILSTEKLEEDLQRVFDLGYFSEDVKAQLSEFEGGAKVTFKVQENPVVNLIQFDGIKEYPGGKLLGLISTTRNKILNTNTLKSDVDKIEKAYHDDGYIAARVIDAKVDPDGTLHIVISEGEIQSIKVSFLVKNETNPDEPETSDTGKTKSYVVTREMRTKPGDTYNEKKLEKDMMRIYNLGFFEDIHRRLEAGDQPGKIVLVVEVQEAKTGNAGFGAGYSSNSGLTGFLTFSERNLKGKGRRVDAKLEIGTSTNDFDISYFEPWLDNKQTSLEVSVYNTLRNDLSYLAGVAANDDYNELRTGFSFTFGRPISDYTKVFAGFKNERVKVTSADYESLSGVYVTRSVTGAIRTDTRDNVFNPTRGRYDSFSVELDGGLLGGNYTYQKNELELRRFKAVRKKQVFAVRMDVAIGTGGMPRADWFDLGGVNTMRGYDEYQFAGTKRVYYNAEYRFLLSGNLSTVLFADAGNAWKRFSEMSLWPIGHMYKSVGVGLRLKIPAFGIGPVRLDYAIALHQGGNKVHFGFGHMF
jgi:outer membrane protein insertion porin family